MKHLFFYRPKELNCVLLYFETEIATLMAISAL